MTSLRQEVSALKDVINKHEETIAELGRKLHMILFAFGFQSAGTDRNIPPSADGQQQQSSSSSATATSVAAVDQPSFSDIVKRQPSTKTIRENIIAAVYVDKAASDRRASSFIVSGLPPSTTVQDQQLVSQLCSDELNITAEITATKRLGRSTDNKPQPILVHVRQQSVAQQIISCAKNLRQSNHMFVRQNVYINYNMTQAEARAAYELRCRRRQATSREGYNKPSANLITVSSPVQTLNPTAPTFQPPSSSLRPIPSQ